MIAIGLQAKITIFEIMSLVLASGGAYFLYRWAKYRYFK